MKHHENALYAKMLHLCCESISRSPPKNPTNSLGALHTVIQIIVIFNDQAWSICCHQCQKSGLVNSKNKKIKAASQRDCCEKMIRDHLSVVKKTTVYANCLLYELIIIDSPAFGEIPPVAPASHPI